MNPFKRLFYRFTFDAKVEKVLSFPLLAFQYLSRATVPDIINVYRPLTGELVLTYAWIEGEEALPTSPLGRLHERFKTYQAQQVRVAEKVSQDRFSGFEVHRGHARVRGRTVVPAPAPRDLSRVVADRDRRSDDPDNFNLMMLTALAVSPSPAPAAECRAEEFRSGEGGDFGGAGATGRWEAPTQVSRSVDTDDLGPDRLSSGISAPAPSYDPPAPAPAPSYYSSSSSDSGSSGYSSSDSSGSD